MKKLTANDPETKSADLVAANLAHLQAIFPEAFTEGRIDFAVLRQLLGGAVDESPEKYGLNWHGKRAYRQLALTPSTGTLLPCEAESVDWDTTQNLMIEGDNLEVLKLLQKSYAGKVKVICIDPPYNTGKDFVYPDDFQDNIANYKNLTSQNLTSNPETNGRFHTDWLNMMYSRLIVARTLLKEDGLLFINMNDSELGHLHDLLRELFGDANFEGNIHWRRRHNQPNDKTKLLGLVAEHIVVYAKNSEALKKAGIGKLDLTGKFSNPDSDPRGDWASKPWKVGSDQSGSRYIITTPTGKVYDEEWMGELSTFAALLLDKRIIWPDSQNGPPRKKYFRFEREQEGQCATNWWPHDEFGHNQGANSEVATLFDGVKNVFSNPKPTDLLRNIVLLSNAKDGDIVLDFFAGSGTTGDAVMQHNIEGKTAVRYVLVQLPERLDSSVKEQKVTAEFLAAINKPLNIAELTKERLRRAAKKIKDEHPDYTGDLGFRVFKLDSSNIKAWDPNREVTNENLLSDTEHLVEGRTDEDVLYELLLKLGLDLTVPIEEKTIGGHTVYSIGLGKLMVCLANNVTHKAVEPLAMGIIKWHKELKPEGDVSLVFKDSGFADDVSKSNLTAILEQHGLKNVRSV
jgi:adenine-specific DNA-methyltransferase